MHTSIHDRDLERGVGQNLEYSQVMSRRGECDPVPT